MFNVSKVIAFLIVAVFVVTDIGIASAQFGYGSSGSRRATPAIPATPAVPRVSPAVPATPAIPSGRVLGASTFNFARGLSHGVRNNDVVELQNRLKDLGFFTFHTSTGFFGPITRASVVAFQLANGIDPIGIVGPLTRAALNSATAKMVQ